MPGFMPGMTLRGSARKLTQSLRRPSFVMAGFIPAIPIPGHSFSFVIAGLDPAIHEAR